MKILGCGFHKTATTSLQQALEHLGYRVRGHDIRLLRQYDAGRVWPFWLWTWRFDAFRDLPWGFIYREFDQRYPGAKFILTVRDTEEWYESLVRHAARTGPTLAREIIYGFTDPRTDRAACIDRFEAHNEAVMDYFSDRPDDLLVVDFTGGDGWEALCPFLGNSTPSEPFPHIRPNIA